MSDSFIVSKDHKISIGEVVSIINSEIQWCHHHPNLVSDDYYHGFVAGLIQVKNMIIAAAEFEVTR